MVVSAHEWPAGLERSPDPQQWGGLARAAARRESAAYQPGDIVSAAVRNLREQENQGRALITGKYRPMIVLGLQNSYGDVVGIGLTGNPTYKSDGNPRDALPDWEHFPLRSQPYVFSWRPVFVPIGDVAKRIALLTVPAAEFIVARVLNDSGRLDQDRFVETVRKRRAAAS